MTYDELVKRLRDLQSITEHCGEQSCFECENRELCDKYDNKALNEAYKEAADAIEELSKPKWIPVTERLPKKEWKIYWICTDSGYQCECRWTKNKYGLGEMDDWGWHIMDTPQYQKVIAWRELPEPYEPPKEEI